MQGFIAEHRGPLLGATGLHLFLLLAAALAGLQWTRSQPPVKLAIEAVVIDARDLPAASRRTPRPPPLTPTPTAPGPQPAQEPTPEAKPAPAPQSVPEPVLKSEPKPEPALEAKPQAKPQPRPQPSPQPTVKSEPAPTPKPVPAVADEAERAAAAKAAEGERRRTELEAGQQAAREAELQRTLAAEEEGVAALARDGVLDEYRAALVQAVERNWIRPGTARAGLECVVLVNQASGGTVIDVRVGSCNGDAAVRESIVTAVYRASPLPQPRDPRAFERRLEFVFKPTE